MKKESEYSDKTDSKIKVKIDSITETIIYFTNLETKEKNYVDTKIKDLPIINKEYEFYIHKTSFGWWLNRYDDIKDDSKLLNNIEYKSKGEFKIAKFLTEMEINFQYEKKFLIKDTKGYDRILYPDFWLLEYGIIIEYFGMNGIKSYDETTELKKQAYKEEKIELISITQYDIKKDKFKIIIIKEIKKIINNKNQILNDCIDKYLENE